MSAFQLEAITIGKFQSSMSQVDKVSCLACLSLSFHPVYCFPQTERRFDSSLRLWQELPGLTRKSGCGAGGLLQTNARQDAECLGTLAAESFPPSADELEDALLFFPHSASHGHPSRVHDLSTEEDHSRRSEAGGASSTYASLFISPTRRCRGSSFWL